MGRRLGGADRREPLVYIVATGISYTAIGVMLVVVATAALVPNGDQSNRCKFF